VPGCYSGRREMLSILDAARMFPGFLLPSIGLAKDIGNMRSRLLEMGLFFAIGLWLLSMAYVSTPSHNEVPTNSFLAVVAGGGGDGGRPIEKDWGHARTPWFDRF